MQLRLSELLESWVQWMLSLWSVPAMGHSSLSLSPSLAAPSSWGQLTAPASPAESEPWTHHRASHKPHLQCQKANRSLSSTCAMATSPSTPLCKPQLKYISKTHSKAKHLKCKPSLHHLDLVPFPQRFTHLSLSIHRPEPVTSTQKVDFSTLSSPVCLLPDQLSFRIHSGFCKSSVFKN